MGPVRPGLLPHSRYLLPSLSLRSRLPLGSTASAPLENLFQVGRAICSSGEGRSKKSLYTLPKELTLVPDEESISFGVGKPFGYHPKTGCCPDLHDHLLSLAKP
jgi:hypothetical protein